MTDIFISVILTAKSGKRFQIREIMKILQEEVSSMFDFYERMKELDNSDNAIGVSPLAYVSLDCAR